MNMNKYTEEEQLFLKDMVAAAVSCESINLNNVQADMERMAIKIYDFAEILLKEHKKRL